MAGAKPLVLAALGGAATLGLGAVQAYTRLEAADRRGAAVEAELARERERAQGLAAELRCVQAALEDERSKSPARRDKLAALEVQLNEAHVENRDLHARLVLEQADSARMRGEMEKMGADLERVRGESDASKQQWMSEKAAFTQRVDGMMQTLTREQAQGEQLTQRLRALGDEKLALEAELANERQTLTREQAQGKELTERLRVLGEEKLALEAELANQRQMLTQEQAQGKELTERLRALGEEKLALETELANERQMLTQEQAQGKELTERLRALDDEKLALETELANERQANKAALTSEREEQAAAMEELKARLRVEQQQREEEQALAAGAQAMLSRKLAQVPTQAPARALSDAVAPPGAKYHARLLVAVALKRVAMESSRASSVHPRTRARSCAGQG